MPKPFRMLSIADVRREIAAFQWTRPVLRVDMHHTFRPDHARFGEIGAEACLEGMWRSHVVERGFEDIAQHVTIMPDGMVWTGRDWNRTPASIGFGMNGNAFMIEVLGDFDEGRDRLEGGQLAAVVAVIAAVQEHFGLPPAALLFHREVPQTEKTCPGSSVSKPRILADVLAQRGLATM